MPNDSITAALNDLLAAEYRNIAPRLCESTVFVSQVSGDAFEIVRGMARASQDHCEALTALIRELGGEPVPRSLDVTTADLHYADLSQILPRITAAQLALVAIYRLASARVGVEPRAAKVVSRITERHKSDLKMLKALGEGAPEAS
jgi:hypothetical protein